MLFRSCPVDRHPPKVTHGLHYKLYNYRRDIVNLFKEFQKGIKFNKQYSKITNCGEIYKC